MFKFFKNKNINVIEQNNEIEKNKIKNNINNRKKATDIGIKKYEWKCSKEYQRICNTCRKRSNKIYSYDKPTSDGYPGEGKCEFKFCHAWAKPIIK